jgi:hypothetical protein
MREGRGVVAAPALLVSILLLLLHCVFLVRLNVLLLLEGSYVASRSLRPLDSPLVCLDLGAAAVGALGDNADGGAARGRSFMVFVGPPLSCKPSGSSRGSVFGMELLASLKPQVVPSSML